MRIIAVILCGCLAAATLVAAQGKPERPRPDVFLITVDTLRSDHVHCYGYERIQTPAIDDLAKQGIRFAEAFTPSPITNTSHTSILTGLLPGSHGVNDFGVALTPNHPTLAEILNKEGYQTAAFIGSVILDSRKLAPGLDRGFQFYDNFPEKAGTKSRWGRLERRGMDVVQRAENWLGAHEEGPHFVWVHLYDPHDPYEPPSPYSDTYKGRLYDGEIAYADSALGHFIAYLKKRNWYDEALIIVVGDHGEGLGEHGEDSHGIFLYDSTTHIPLILKQPKEQEAGRVVEEQVRTTDILPTILDLLGISGPESLDGASLKTTYSDSGTPSRIVFGETDYPVRFGWAPLRSVRIDGFKLIEAPRPEFYDLRSDTGELQNHYMSWDAEVQKLRKMLADSRRAQAHAEKSSPAAVPSTTTDELRALGYLGPADAHSSTNVPEPSLRPDPKDKIAEHNLLHVAMMESEDGRTVEARMVLERVLRLDNQSEIALLQLGRLEMDSKNYAEAARHLGRASELRPDDAEIAFDYGRALDLSGDLAGARRALEASLKQNPEHAAARVLLGQVCLESNDPRAAEDAFETALLSQPASVQGQTGLAKALLRQKKFGDAVELLKESVTSPGNNADLFELLAQAYTGLGKRAAAQAAREKARQIRAAEASH